MTKRILTASHNSVTYLHDEQDGKMAIETVTDVTAVLELAKAAHNEGIRRTGMGDRLGAVIPIDVIDAWAKRIGKTFQDVMQDQKLFTRFLQDPDHSGFVVDKGVLQ